MHCPTYNNLYLQSFPALKAPISWYLQEKKENKIMCQSFIAQAISATRPKGSIYAEGEYGVFLTPVDIQDLNYTKMVLMEPKFRQQFNAILTSSSQKIR